MHDVWSVKENIKHDMFKFSWVTTWHATGCPYSHMKFKDNCISYLMFWSFHYFNMVFDINLDVNFNFIVANVYTDPIFTRFAGA